MTYTENYALNQWAKTDRIQMSDFNADNLKLDAALKANADAISAETAARSAAVASKADTSALNALSAAVTALQQASYKIATGTFAGTGATGTRTYSLGFKPKLLIVRTNNVNTSYVHDRGVIALGPFCVKINSNGGAYLLLSGSPCTLTDDGFTLALDSTVNEGLDAEGSTLTYWAVY